MSNRAPRDRVVPWLLLLALTLVLWLGYALAAKAPSEVAGSRGEAVAEAGGETARRNGGRLEPDELLGFGEESLLPVVFQALDGIDCDFDDPFSNCQ